MERRSEAVAFRSIGFVIFACAAFSGVGVVQTQKGETSGEQTGALVSHWVAFAQRPEFEVASVKKVTFNGFLPDFAPRRSGTLVAMHNTQVGPVIGYAYRLEGGHQLVGIPDWPDDSRWFDIDARTPPDTTDDQVRLMLQSLLADRFKLKVHREARQSSDFVLTLGKGKLKIATAAGGEEPLRITIEGRSYTQRRGTCTPSAWREGDHLVCRDVTMETIASQVGAGLRAPIVDRTGLSGNYDLDLLFWPDGRPPQPDEVTTPSLAQALSGLGLKLEKGPGLVQVLVIDHIEPPSGN